MDYLIRFIQTHETFRQPEIEALAELNEVKIEWLSYSHDVGSLSRRGQSEYTLTPTVNTGDVP